MAYLKPQSPLQKHSNNDYFYPITTIDQIIVNDINRLNNYSIVGSREVRASLLLSNWIENNNQYEQSITIEDLNENYSVNVKIEYTGNLDTDLLINQSASCVNYATQENNVITFYCLTNKPENNIPIIVGVNI